jgi:hypothetical protein
MVCYRIFLLCPIYELENQNTLNFKCIDVLTRQNGGYLREMRQSHESYIYILDICDRDASEFLWQLPHPFTVLFVFYRDNQQVLFAHRVFQLRILCRSRIYDDKAVFWSAKALEKHLGDVKIDTKAYLEAFQANEANQK